MPNRRIRGSIRVPGAKLAYEWCGSGLPLVLVPPIIADRRMWDKQLDVLANHFQVIRYDLRGYGRSSAGPRTARHAEDLVRLLTALHLESVAMIGFDSGAEIALEVAAEHPGLVRTLVLANPRIHGLIDRVLAAGHPLPADVPVIVRSRAERRIQKMVTLRVAGIRLQNFLRLLSRAWPRSRRARYPLELWAEEPVLDRLAQITAPTLIVRGEWSAPLVHAGDRWLRQALPNGSVATMPRASFFIQMEAPAAFNRIVLDFLATHYRANASA